MRWSIARYGAFYRCRDANDYRHDWWLTVTMNTNLHWRQSLYRPEKKKFHLTFLTTDKNADSYTFVETYSHYDLMSRFTQRHINFFPLFWWWWRRRSRQYLLHFSYLLLNPALTIKNAPSGNDKCAILRSIFKWHAWIFYQKKVFRHSISKANFVWNIG